MEQCRPLNKLAQSDDLSDEQQEFLSKSVCSRGGEPFYVCCPHTFTIDDLPSGKQCGAQVTDKIVGGEKAALSEFPWYVFDLLRKSLNFL